MKTLSRIFALLGGALLLLTAVIAFGSRNASARLLSTAEEAQTVTGELMEDLRCGDLTAAGQLLYGQLPLENTPELGSAYAESLWQAYWDSFQYTFSGDCYAADTGLCRDVTVMVLDIPALLPAIEGAYQTLLPQLAAEANGNVLDSDGGYREDFIFQVLDQATRQVLADQCSTRSWNLTLNLAYRDDRWWVVGNADLNNILSGGLTGKEG